MTNKGLTILEAARIYKKSTRTIRRHLSKLSPSDKTKYTSIQETKLYLSKEWLDNTFEPVETPKERHDDTDNPVTPVTPTIPAIDKLEGEIDRLRAIEIAHLKIISEQVGIISKLNDRTESMQKTIDAAMSELIRIIQITYPQEKGKKKKKK